jgi:hypothetical protein
MLTCSCHGYSMRSIFSFLNLFILGMITAFLLAQLKVFGFFFCYYYYYYYYEYIRVILVSRIPEGINKCPCSPFLTPSSVSLKLRKFILRVTHLCCHGFSISFHCPWKIAVCGHDHLFHLHYPDFLLLGGSKYS